MNKEKLTNIIYQASLGQPVKESDLLILKKILKKACDGLDNIISTLLPSKNIQLQKMQLQKIQKTLDEDNNKQQFKLK